MQMSETTQFDLYSNVKYLRGAIANINDYEDTVGRSIFNAIPIYYWFSCNHFKKTIKLLLLCCGFPNVDIKVLYHRYNLDTNSDRYHLFYQ